MTAAAASVELLDAAPPGRLAWRALCARLDAAPPPDAARLAALARALEPWPWHLRRLPGAWLRTILEGRDEPRACLAACLDATLFADAAVARRTGWAESPRLRGLRVLKLHDDVPGDDAARAFVASPHLTELRELWLSRGITDAGAVALARSPSIARLEVLGLQRNRVAARGLAALLASPHAAPVRALHLGRNALGDAGASVLAASDARPALRTLDLDCNQLTGAGVASLARSPLLAGVTELNLSHNAIGAAGCRALAESPHLDALRALFLHGCELGDDDVRPLLDARGPRRWANLALSANRLTLASIDRLARSAQLDGVVELDVCHNAFDPVEAEARLRRSAHVARARRLCV